MSIACLRLGSAWRLAYDQPEVAGLWLTCVTLPELSVFGLSLKGKICFGCTGAVSSLDFLRILIYMIYL